MLRKIHKVLLDQSVSKNNRMRARSIKINFILKNFLIERLKTFRTSYEIYVTAFETSYETYYRVAYKTYYGRVCKAINLIERLIKPLKRPMKPIKYEI